MLANTPNYLTTTHRLEEFPTVMLCDADIDDAIQTGQLVIDPYNPNLLQPASLDVRLGADFRWQNHRWIEKSSFYTLGPGEFVLGCTLESVKIPPDLAVRIEGKSTWGRQGLMIHITAGFIDPGFHGDITLELKNLTDEKLYLPIGAAIAQLSFHRLSSPSRHPYGSAGLRSRYQGQRGATAARPPHHD